MLDPHRTGGVEEVAGALHVDPSGAGAIELGAVRAPEVDETGGALERRLPPGCRMVEAVREVELDDTVDGGIGLESRPHPPPQRARRAGEDNGGHGSTMPV